MEIVEEKTLTEKYSIESLKKTNASYDMQYRINQYDVDKANMYVKLIEDTRSNMPIARDIVQLTTKHGDYYANAHIENIIDNELNVCEQPYVPFIYPFQRGI